MRMNEPATPPLSTPSLPSDPPEDPEAGHSLEVLLPTRAATITKTLVVIIGIVFVLDALMVGRLTNLGAKSNHLILDGGEYYRLFTVMFLHAGLAHLFMNTYALWVIGQDVERFFGHGRFLLVLVLGGLTASLASLAFTPAPAVGASGAVFAIFAAEMVLLIQNRSLFGAAARQRLQSLGFLLLINAAIGFFGASLIDNWAHIGGFLGGAAVSWLIAPRFRVAWPLGALGPGQLVDDLPAGRTLWVAGLWLAGLVGALAVLTLVGS